MAVPNNILQNVQTYQRAELAWLLNSFYAISRSNKKFKNFDELVANLGDTVTFDLTPRFVTNNGLVITQQPSNQRVQTLTCGSALNIATGYTDQQFLFNVEDYMNIFGKAAAIELGSQVEAAILKNFVSGMMNTDPASSSYGSINYQSGPYRFYGNGVTAINSYQQLAQALANFRDYGCAPDRLEGILPVANIPAIIGSGLNQFALNRNNMDAETWELGPFNECDWFTSNLLPLHTSGTIGDAASPNNVMTVVSTNDPTGNNVTQITFTEPTGGTSTTAIRAGDLIQFNDGVSGQPNMRFLTFSGHLPTQQPVQFRAIADAATSSGTVTVSLQTINGVGLVSAVNQNQNINNAIAAGMTVTVMPSHRAGCIHSGNQLYVAMPRLPEQTPYPSSTIQDEESGASLRHYWGVQFGQNNRAYVRDIIFGATMVPENSMRVLFPL